MTVEPSQAEVDRASGTLTYINRLMPTALKPPCYRHKAPCGAILRLSFSPQGFVYVALGFSLASGIAELFTECSFCPAYKHNTFKDNRYVRSNSRRTAP